MNPANIAITCSTYYPSWYQGKLRSIHHTDKIRGDLALEFIQKGIQHGYSVVVTDGFSTKTFQKILKQISNERLYILKRKKKFARSVARRQAYFKAVNIQGIHMVVYSEPEKIGLIDHIPKIIKPILAGEADIVIPKRDEKLFAQTYPKFQYESEVEGNVLYNEQLHLYKLLPHSTSFDMFFGPRAFAVNSRVQALLRSRFHFEMGMQSAHKELFNPEELSDYLFFPVVVALKRKLNVSQVTIPFRYPILQKQNEEIGERSYFEEKRRMQRLSLLVELMHFLSYLERRKKRS